MANPEQRPIGDVSVPLNTGDVREFKKEMGRLLEDPLGVAESIDQFLGLNIYTWVELQSVLGILFTMEEREMIRHSGMRVWDRERQGPDQGDQKWPMQDPGWNNQNERHRQNMSDLQWMIMQGIWEAVPKGQNIGKAPKDNFEISDTVWYIGEEGKLNIQRISVEVQNPEIPIRVKQYPISLEGQKGLKPVVENSVHHGVLESCVSPHNTPILPVKKPDGSYRLVQDLRAVNQRTITHFPGVAKPDTS
ncbi:hypothetical protein DUI87_12000 [Hirundo rustica rustica]|uniref:Core shell protein Gag P30 domain-containing protein n=1 Tax=Hirundo rustica rustica TaxID=333673 RepID=A0A3M0KD06_HIRRU|nr:hypothetical protein DUI87_12000 [Hirundo rustica rustica]